MSRTARKDVLHDPVGSAKIKASIAHNCNVAMALYRVWKLETKKRHMSLPRVPYKKGETEESVMSMRILATLSGFWNAIEGTVPWGLRTRGEGTFVVFAEDDVVGFEGKWKKSATRDRLDLLFFQQASLLGHFDGNHAHVLTEVFFRELLQGKLLMCWQELPVHGVTPHSVRILWKF